MDREGRLRFSRQLTNFRFELQLPRKAADENDKAFLMPIPPVPIGSTSCEYENSETEDLVLRPSDRRRPSSKVDNGPLAIPGLTERSK